MNTPAPKIAAAPQMPQVDPTTPGPQGKQTALGAAATTAVAGTPTAIVIVWWLATYAHVTDPVATAAIASTVASAAGYLWRVLQALLQKKGIDPGE